MSALAQVAVHSSVFPESVERDLLRSLQNRSIDPKFHYVTYKQSRKWLALHEAYSPSRTDADCAALYDHGFHAAANASDSPVARVIGLGCGGGQKDARFLSLLAAQGRAASYTPSDISLALVLTASQAAQAAVPKINCHPLVCDLAGADDLRQVFDGQADVAGSRFYTFFGMIPNFEPEVIMPRLAALIRPGDQLLFSANLAPGPEYAAGVQHVLPGYNNPPTRDWLLTFLYDLGVGQGDGSLEFSVEDSSLGLKRIVADYCFAAPRTLEIPGGQFTFRPDDKLRLFFSYRYTPARVVSLLSKYNLSITGQWVTASGEEGIFLCQR